MYYMRMMEGSISKRISNLCLMILMIVVAVAVVADCRSPTLHRVGGGKESWAPKINFTKWATGEQFYVGDWLYFGFDKTRYNVLEVNKTSYEKCIEDDFLKNITRGGRDVFNLTDAKTYYFLSGHGYCFQGMKVAICVEEDSPPHHHGPTTNATTITINGGHSSNVYGGQSVFFSVFTSLVMHWIFVVVTVFKYI